MALRARTDRCADLSMDDTENAEEGEKPAIGDLFVRAYLRNRSRYFRSVFFSFIFIRRVRFEDVCTNVREGTGFDDTALSHDQRGHATIRGTFALLCKPV